MNEGVFRIGSIPVGPGNPAVTIAEAACEHLGSLEVAKRMVDAAAEVGADIIKFQMHLPEEMVPNSIHFWGGSMDEVLAKYNLRVDDHEELIKYCQTQGIQYLCTPFCAGAADVLDRLGVPAFKTGSGEMTNIPMLRSIARKNKPMIVSTGMATVEEIGQTVAALREESATFALMNCTSAYPPAYEQINLRFMDSLKEKFGVVVGHSDHTPEVWTAVAAVTLGASIIEKHFTLDRRLKGPDHHVSLEPADFRTMVDAIRKIEAALGSTKTVYAEEQVVRAWAHHSVVAVKDISAGSIIQADMIAVKRPGTGIPARFLPELSGRTAARSISVNTILQWQDLK